MTSIEDRVPMLIRLLKDRSARVDERDDAAIDLGKSDLPEALRALLDVAADATENDLVLASSGESIAEIWLRTGGFDRKALSNLHGTASREIRSMLMSQRPEWLDT